MAKQKRTCGLDSACVLSHTEQEKEGRSVNPRWRESDMPARRRDAFSARIKTNYVVINIRRSQHFRRKVKVNGSDLRGAPAVEKMSGNGSDQVSLLLSQLDNQIFFWQF